LRIAIAGYGSGQQLVIASDTRERFGLIAHVGE
jgi:hypothetical protein